MGALRSDTSDAARQEAARWAAVLPRAQQDVGTECAASGQSPRQAGPLRLDPPRLDPLRAPDQPPMIAVPTTTRATPTQAATPPADPVTTASAPAARRDEPPAPARASAKL